MPARFISRISGRKAAIALAVTGLLGTSALVTQPALFAPTPAIAQSALAGAPSEGFADLVEQVIRASHI